MPTAFDFRSDDIDTVVLLLNKAKKGNLLDETELQTLARCFNNSLVGTSKLLHCINPDLFPIWDSRVYRYITGNKPHHYRLNKSNLYLDFQKFCLDLTSKRGYSNVHSVIEKKLNKKLSPIRSIELLMYASSKKI
jgi:hypothetical protein